MDSIFKIQKYNKDEFLVVGLEKDNSEYIPEDSLVLDRFRQYTFSQSVTLNLVSFVNSKQEETLTDFQFVEHVDIDHCSFKFKADSLFKVDHVILPTKGWYDYLLSLESSTISRYNRIVYFDPVSQNIIEVKGNELVVIDIPTLLEYFNLDLLNNSTNTIIFGSKYTISTSKMKDAYTKVSVQLLSGTRQCLSRDDYETLKYKRDLLMMAIDTISYSIELLRYFDALKIIEDVNRCLWLYNDFKINSCGCN